MSRLSLNFSLFVALSLLLHFGVFFYFAAKEEEPTPADLTPSPIFVDLRPATEKPREFDLPAPQQTPPRTQPARKQAEQDQVARQETAPRGSDSRDSSILPPVVEPETAIKPTPPPVSEEGKLPPVSLENLLLSSKNAAQSVADLDPETNRKMRRDVEEGRAVWLDTEKDILGSFYKRFRNSVEDVWDYPKEAIARGEFGVCLYRIEINRAGVLVNNSPQLLKSSGSARLDAEAARAVLAASPRFGFLPDSYHYETLTIFAYFDYRLGGRALYGERFY